MRGVSGALAVWAIILGACAGPARAQPGGGPPPAKVVLDAAVEIEAQQWREVTGELRAPRRSVLAAQEEGLVVEMALEAGDPVAPGQVLARLDDTRARIDVERAETVVRMREAEITEARTLVDKTRRDFSRISESFQRNAASRNELDDSATLRASAEARLERAVADLATARAELARSEKRLADMVIQAPFSGRVVEKRTEVGQWVRAGDAVLEVLALDWLEAWLDVPEALVDQVSTPGAMVHIRVSALRTPGAAQVAETRAAPVTAVVPQADRLSRLFPVRVRLDNSPPSEGGAPSDGWGGRLKPGMSVTGLVPAGERRPVLTVHRDAVRRNDTGAYVFMDAGGVAQMAFIEVLFPVASGERLAVRSAVLRPGMNVVVEGNERLFPGQPLAPMNAGAARNPAQQGG